MEDRIMSAFNEVLDKCKTQMNKCGIKYNEDLLTSVAKSLGPSIYKQDALLVAAGDKTEVETIKKNFVAKKLGVEGSAADTAIEYAVEKIGSSNRQKLRPVFYYLIVEKLGKQAVYK